MSKEPYYDEPRYYDIAFGQDIEREAGFVNAVLAKHARREVRSVLDIACGTGRFTLELARQGFDATGLDLSRAMLAYTRDRAHDESLLVELFAKDMTAFQLFRRYDAAICMTGSLNYLVGADRLKSHFSSVADHLRQGGVYLIDLAVAAGDGTQLPSPREWTGKRDTVEVTARYEVEPGGESSGIARERLTLVGRERGWERVWEQESNVHIGTWDQFRALIATIGGFEVAAAYADFSLEAIYEGGDGGNRVLVVLVKTAADRPVRTARPADRAGGRGDRRPGRGDRSGRDRPGRRDRPRREERRPRHGAGQPSGEGRGRPPAQAQAQTQAAAGRDAGGNTQEAPKRRRRRRPRRRKPKGPPTADKPQT